MILHFFNSRLNLVRMRMEMKNRRMAVLAAAGTIVILALGGTLAARTVFAAEQKVAITSENSGTMLHALADVEVKKVYKDSVYGDTGCSVVLPAGYVKSESVKGMYLSEHHPLDSSNIYYTVSENVDTDIVNQMLNSDDYKRKTEQKFKESYGAGAAISDYKMTKMTIDGCPAYRIELSCTVEEMQMDQLTFIIMADKTYTITYSQSSDDERMEEFEESAETIQVVFEEK